uniref:Ribonucloprotein n=1 Tax=Steinernema glaseri TaxID=37863 RepID=A0A1I8ABS4_9BILA
MDDIKAKIAALTKQLTALSSSVSANVPKNAPRAKEANYLSFPRYSGSGDKLT